MPNTIEPIGIFELFIFKGPPDSDGQPTYYVQIATPIEVVGNLEACLQAAASLTSYVASNSAKGLYPDVRGYEKILELITAKAMDYQFGPPIPQSPDELPEPPEENPEFPNLDHDF